MTGIEQTSTLSLVLLGLAIAGGVLLFLNFLLPWRRWKRWRRVLFSLWHTCENDLAGRATAFIETTAVRIVESVWGSYKTPRRLAIMCLCSVVAVNIAVFATLAANYVSAYLVLPAQSLEDIRHEHLDLRASALEGLDSSGIGAINNERRTTYADQALFVYGGTRIEHLRQYEEIANVVDSITRIRFETAFAETHDEYVSDAMHLVVRSFSISALYYLIPMYISLVVSVILTLLIIRSNIYISRNTKIPRAISYSGAFLADLVLAICFAGLSIALFSLVEHGIGTILFNSPPIRSESEFYTINVVDARDQISHILSELEPEFINRILFYESVMYSNFDIVSFIHYDRLIIPGHTLLFDRPITSFSEYLNAFYASIVDFWTDMVFIAESRSFDIGPESTYRNWMFILSLLPLAVHMTCILLYFILIPVMSIAGKAVGEVASRLEQEEISPAKLLFTLFGVLFSIVLALNQIGR